MVTWWIGVLCSDRQEVHTGDSSAPNTRAFVLALIFSTVNLFNLKSIKCRIFTPKLISSVSFGDWVDQSVIYVTSLI